MPQQNHELQTFEYHLSSSNSIITIFRLSHSAGRIGNIRRNIQSTTSAPQRTSLSFSIPSPVREQLQSTLTRMCCVPGRHF